MKKLIILLLVLMMAVFSVDAADTEATLTIKAYKKAKSNSGTLEMKVIDALTGTLATFAEGSTGSKIDMTNYVKTYLGDTSKKYATNDDITGLTRRAAFSVHVSGNYKGSFTVTTTIKSLAYYADQSNESTRYCTASKDATSGKITYTESLDNYLTTKFYFIDYQLLFTSEDTASVEYTPTGSTEKYTDTIKSGTVKADGSETKGYIPAITVIPGTGEGTKKDEHTIAFSWTVSTTNPADVDYVSYYWDVRASFAMILEEGSTSTAHSYNYKDLPKGVYKAPVTVTIASS